MNQNDNPPIPCGTRSTTFRMLLSDDATGYWYWYALRKATRTERWLVRLFGSDELTLGDEHISGRYIKRLFSTYFIDDWVYVCFPDVWSFPIQDDQPVINVREKRFGEKREPA